MTLNYLDSKNSCFGWIVARIIGLFFLIFSLINPAYSKESNESDLLERRIDKDLRTALDEKDINKFEELLASGADPTKWFGDTQAGWVMCSATLSGKEQYLEKLLQFGFDPNFRQSNITSELSIPLGCAIRSDNLEAIKILVEAGADLSKNVCRECSMEYQTSLLSEAVLVNKFDLALWIYENGAFSKAQMETVKRLIEFLPFPKNSPEFENRENLIESMKLQGLPVKAWSAH